jgi:hypothetical protein
MPFEEWSPVGMIGDGSVMKGDPGSVRPTSVCREAQSVICHLSCASLGYRLFAKRDYFVVTVGDAPRDAGEGM